MTCVNIIELKDFTICSEDFMVTFVNMLYNKSLRSYSDVVVGKLEATLNISH